VPPQPGEALAAGWSALRQNLKPVLLATLCAVLLCLIPLVGVFLALPGVLKAALKAVRGEPPRASDGFSGLRAPLDHIMIGLLQSAGIVLLCLGIHITQGIFIWGSFLILEQGMGWAEAKDVCMAGFRKDWLGWTLFVAIIACVGSLGILAVGVGLFVSIPFGACSLAWAYDRMVREEAWAGRQAEPSASP